MYCYLRSSFTIVIDFGDGVGLVLYPTIEHVHYKRHIITMAVQINKRRHNVLELINNIPSQPSRETDCLNNDLDTCSTRFRLQYP